MNLDSSIALNSKIIQSMKQNCLDLHLLRKVKVKFIVEIMGVLG
jgi:hypothetical protein